MPGNDLSWTSQPMLEGEYETGCHTHQGNDLILYCQTTRQLHDRRETIYSLAYRKHRYDLPAIVEALRDPIKELFRETTQSYRRQIREDPGVDLWVYPDFYNCCIRDYVRWLEDFERCHNPDPVPASRVAC